MYRSAAAMGQVSTSRPAHFLGDRSDEGESGSYGLRRTLAFVEWSGSSPCTRDGSKRTDEALHGGSHVAHLWPAGEPIGLAHRCRDDCIPKCSGKRPDGSPTCAMGGCYDRELKLTHRCDCLRTPRNQEAPALDLVVDLAKVTATQKLRTKRTFCVPFSPSSPSIVTRIVTTQAQSAGLVNVILAKTEA